MTKTLIIDDDPTFLSMACTMVRDAGFEVDGAQTGDEGVEMFRRDHHDLVIADIFMPAAGDWTRSTNCSTRIPRRGSSR